LFERNPAVDFRIYIKAAMDHRGYPVLLDGMKIIADVRHSMATMGNVHTLGVFYFTDKGMRATQEIRPPLENSRMAESAYVKEIRETLVRLQYDVLVLMNPLPKENVRSA